MRLFIYVCVYEYIQICICISLSIYVSIYYEYKYVYIHKYLLGHICMHACILIYMPLHDVSHMPGTELAVRSLESR